MECARQTTSQPQGLRPGHMEHSSWAKRRKSSTSEQGGLLKGQGELLLCQGPPGLVRAGTGHRKAG